MQTMLIKGKVKPNEKPTNKSFSYLKPQLHKVNPMQNQVTNEALSTCKLTYDKDMEERRKTPRLRPKTIPSQKLKTSAHHARALGQTNPATPTYA